MGKYMKKGKITGDVAVMEIGVRTRARTLALQPNPELSYLQLRNRRLEKPPLTPKQQHPKSQGRARAGKEEEGRFGNLDEVVMVSRREKTDEFGDVGPTEASCGENNLEFDSRERSTRESTPCSLIRDSENISTPGSATRPTCPASATRRTRSMQRAIPTMPEMEEFFARFEQQQQKQFIEKYNYDILNDLPLPGRYEWVRVDN